MDSIGQIDRRRRNLQVVLFLIILATLPFYCAGFVLLGTAPGMRATPTAQATTPAALTRTLATSTRIAFPSLTPLPGGGINLPPTPGQFFPTVVFPTAIFPTSSIPTSTFFVFPTATDAPSLTPYPTDVLFPSPTESPLPFPTDSMIVTATATLDIPDSDGDGVPDNIDLCPGVPGIPPDGCPAILPTSSEPTPIPPGT
ncbi:MAG: hypothetical protein IAE89_16115 [Anaerolineae bacterium]|nr:hypothetical protein [Anaerolineae bacterium]